MDHLIFDHQRNEEWKAKEYHVEPKQAFHKDLGCLELAVDNLLGTLGLIEFKVLRRLQHQVRVKFVVVFLAVEFF